MLRKLPKTCNQVVWSRRRRPHCHVAFSLDGCRTAAWERRRPGTGYPMGHDPAHYIEERGGSLGAIDSSSSPLSSLCGFEMA
jgi:hypothetical protein